jgi:hypothetical protein
VRGDVDVADVGSLVAGRLAMEWDSQHDGQPGHLVGVVCDGLRGRGH